MIRIRQNYRRLQRLADAGFHILATKGTQKVLADAGIVSEFVYKLSEGRPNISDLITNGKIDLIINTPRGADGTLDDSYLRKAAIRKKIPYITTMLLQRQLPPVSNP